MKVLAATTIHDENDQIASEMNRLLSSHGVFVLNLLGSPGAGKTSLLEQTIMHLRQDLNLAVIEGDLYTNKDAERIARLGVPVIQINTCGGYHLNAGMIQAVLPKLNLENLDLLIIENIGNLVCPAEYYIGEDAKATVLSITEGEDKPLKYPLAFKESAAVVLNKLDLLPYTGYDIAAVIRDVTSINPEIILVCASCRTAEGLKDWVDWLRLQVGQKKRNT